MQVLVLLVCLLLGAASALSGVRIEEWLFVPGYQITDALAQGELDRDPDLSRTGQELEAVASGGSAISVTGIVRAPEDGTYRFLIAADDTALLFVSTDTNPKNLKQVALVPAYGGRRDWKRYDAQTSAPIELKAGQRCLVQAIVQNGGGPGHVDVGWELPDGRSEPIPSSCIETPPDRVPPPTYSSVPVKLVLKPDTVAATTPGQHKYIRGATATVGDRKIEMSYLLFLPSGYDTGTDPVPLFIFLHGNTHQGIDLEGILNEGPADYLNRIPSLREWMPMAMLFPQLPPGWRWDTPGAAEMTNELVREVCKLYPRFDRQRIYLSGLSMGGKGTWLMAYDAPDIYAAIVPISSVAVRPKSAAKTFANLHTWIICGERDHLFTEGSKQMYRAMSSLGESKVKLTVVPNGDHGCWAKYYPERSFYEQVMKYRKAEPNR